MITECLEVFQNVLERDENVILREYIPADGTYILVDKNYEIKGQPIEIKMDKKTGNIDRSASDYDKICYYDYHSKLISMNKPQDSAKIIHSNNYYSFWVKKESILNGKLTEEVIDKYYEILEEPVKKYEKGKALELYQAVEENLGSVNKEILQKNKAWIKEHIFSINELVSVDLEKKDYLKIFFEAHDLEYLKEGKRYFIPNIYNSNNYNIKIQDKVLGLPDNNQGMNAKKPFLSIKTRKVPTPYLLDEEQVMLQKQLFDHFMNFVSAGKYNVYVDLERNEFIPCRNDDENKGFPPGSVCGFFLRLQKGKNEAEIHYQDVVPFYEDKLQDEMEYINYMQIPNEKHPEYEMEYHTYDKYSELERLIGDIFFSKMLRNNYFTESEKLSITDEGLKRSLLLYRMELFSWLRLGHKDGIKKIAEKAFLEMIKSSIINGHTGKAVRQINLRLSLLRYLTKGGEYMADFSVSLREKMKQKLASNESVGLENDTEYYYAVGQLTRYYIFLNRGSKKNESLINPMLNAKSSQAIKEKLLQYYKKYNYDIMLGAKKADILYKMILGYETEGKVKQDMICMGFVDNNLVLEKKEEKKDE
jgi:CRISPR-associated protein Csh1